MTSRNLFCIDNDTVAWTWDPILSLAERQVAFSTELTSLTIHPIYPKHQLPHWLAVYSEKSPQPKKKVHYDTKINMESLKYNLPNQLNPCPSIIHHIIPHLIWILLKTLFHPCWYWTNLIPLWYPLPFMKLIIGLTARIRYTTDESKKPIRRVYSVSPHNC